MPSGGSKKVLKEEAIVRLMESWKVEGYRRTGGL
jgi:hypothetical protein